MFIDASALVAILAREEDSETLALRLSTAPERYVSPLAIWEATHGLHRSTEMSLERAEALVRGLLETTNTTIMAIDDAIGREATRASRLFGKGRHPARLNFGDCFAYACAKVLDVPLLAKGNDFPQTDIKLA